MDKRIQLVHPRGKKAVSISEEKYLLLKRMLLKHLRTRESATMGGITAAVKKEIRQSGKEFKGSLPWYLEWVKLDLEARMSIERVPGTRPQEYRLL